LGWTKRTESVKLTVNKKKQERWRVKGEEGFEDGWHSETKETEEMEFELIQAERGSRCLRQR
jgi:hypothetical protein